MVGVLTLAYVLSFVDRQVISLLVVPIRRDLGISDTQVSLLIGLAFSLFYTAMAVPIARLADRASRRGIITAGILGWCLMTVACGLTRSFWQLFLARMGVGVGEATLSPAAQSMIADTFPRRTLGRALGVFHTGISVGMGVALVIGGFVVTALSRLPPLTLPLVGTLRPWQLTFALVGLPGLLVAALMATVREPYRRGLSASAAAPEEADSGGLAAVLRFMAGRWRAYAAVFLGQAAIITMAFGFSAWVPTLFIRTYGWTAGRIGVAFGLVMAVFGIAGVTLGGWMVDSFHRRGQADGPIRAMLGAVLLLPLGGLAPLMPSPTWALALIAPLIVGSGIPTTAGSVALMTLTPNRMRARVTALYMLANSLIGMTLGPTAVALITDYLFRDDSALRYSLAVLIAAVFPVALLTLLWGRRPYRLAAGEIESAGRPQSRSQRKENR